MDENVDKKINKENIILYDLYTKNYIYEYNSYYKKKEIAINNEIKINHLKHYYEINNEKGKELDSVFKRLISKRKSYALPKFLRNGKLYEIFNGKFKIYDREMNKINELKLQPDYNIISTIELDNNDLIFLSKERVLLIYRLNYQQYILHQKIKEDMRGYKIQTIDYGCKPDSKYYIPDFIKDISRNRFICITNYGFKIYSLNSNGEYSIILLTKHLEGIKKIYEINENKFIFCTKKIYGPSLGETNNKYLIELIELHEIANEELNNILKEVEKEDYFDKYYSIQTKDENTNNYGVIKNVFATIKYGCTCKELYKYETYLVGLNFSDYIIMKNKYFLIGLVNNIFIFDLDKEKHLKTYEISIFEKNKLININDIDIIKWDCIDKNEFLMFVWGNIVLFELNEDNNIKVINQIYFPNFNNLTKIKGKNNTFYSYEDCYNLNCGKFHNYFYVYFYKNCLTNELF